jgi:hypothetical protein
MNVKEPFTQKRNNTNCYHIKKLLLQIKKSDFFPQDIWFISRPGPQYQYSSFLRFYCVLLHLVIFTCYNHPDPFNGSYALQATEQ